MSNTTSRRRMHGMWGTRLHRIWTHMRERCNNPRCKCFAYYGGAGVKVCPEWDSFLSFHSWASGNSYGETLTLDRMDPEKGYSPENCRWITRSENSARARNTDKKKRVTGARGKAAGMCRALPVVCLTTGQRFESIIAAARSVKVNSGSMWYHVRGRTKACAGMEWRLAA